MTSREIKSKMMDYVAGKLEGSGFKIVPVRKSLVSGIVSNYIKVDNKGTVILVDQAYPGDSLSRVYDIATQNGFKDIAFAILKDGETFFRSGVAGIYGPAGLHSVRAKRRGSLKEYAGRLDKIISFRPEEVFIFGKKKKKDGAVLQYYQPGSECLGEGLENFLFRPVVFDYSHIPRGEFRPDDRESKRLHLWTARRHNTSQLVLDEGYLKRKEVYDAGQLKKQKT
jgi:hypothetical protein